METKPTIEEMIGLIKGAAAGILEIPASQVSEDADIVDELDIDSLQQLELLTEVEQQLGVRFDADDWRGAHDIAGLAERVLMRLENPTGR